MFSFGPVCISSSVGISNGLNLWTFTGDLWELQRGPCGLLSKETFQNTSLSFVHSACCTLHSKCSCNQAASMSQSL